MSAAHVYPSGPLPTDNPSLTSLQDTPFLVLYCYAGVVAFATAAWALYRHVMCSRMRSKTSDLEAEIPKNDASMSASQTDRGSQGNFGEVAVSVGSKTELRRQAQAQYFRASWAGKLALCLVTSVLPVLLAIFVTVLVDQYWGCQFTGIDALCYYGSYPLSGSSELNARFFLVLWLITLAFLSTLLLFKRGLRNFFRLPCPVVDAGFIAVTAEVEEEVLMKSTTALVSWVRSTKDWIRRRKPSNTYRLTVPILSNADGIPYYELQAKRFVMAPSGRFEPAMQTAMKTFKDAADLSSGLSASRARELLNYLGPNKIAFNPDTYTESIAKELCSPFYLYQLMVYMYWNWFGYFFVGAPLLLLVVVTGFLKIAVNRNGQKKVAAIADARAPCYVRRDGRWQLLDSQDLVPGDVVRVQGDGWAIPSDLLLLQGSCVVNEAAITGEATPVQKVGMPEEAVVRGEPYNPLGKGKRHTLYAGTTVLQAGDPGSVDLDTGGQKETVAVVVGTAINTSKGKILSSILYPAKMTFLYDEELVVVLLLLAVFVAVAFVAVSLLLTYNGQATNYATTFAYAVFTVSQVVNPLLPIGLVAGHFLSTVRLAKTALLCINPSRIAIAGKIRVFCFDKTGTLTKDNLEFLCARSVVREGASLRLGRVWFPVGSTKGLDPNFRNAIASCHAVTKYGAKLVGNQVEVEMVGAVEWDVKPLPDNTVLLTSSDGTESLVIVRRFEFDHDRQTMSVVVRDAGRNSFIFAKGSVESIMSITDGSSRPPEFEKTAGAFALEGCYVLAMAMKPLGDMSDEDISNLGRDQVESGLELLGLIAFRNELKDDTGQAISSLKAGDVRPVMITGDNAECGNYIASKCGMLNPDSRVLLGKLGDDGHLTWGDISPMSRETGLRKKEGTISTSELLSEDNLPELQAGRMELAVSGNKAYDALIRSGDLDRLLLYIRIFARISPSNKASIVRAFISQGIIVGMCGDGGNDCGALRAAHAGVALSDAEASLVAPFTARNKSCSSVVDLLKEGKCALHTNLASYRFLVMYGQLFAIWKFTGFYFGVNIPTACYLLIDVAAVVFLTYALTCALPNETLKPDRPTASLFSAYTLSSVLGNLFFNTATFIIIQILMPLDPGYIKWPASLSSATQFWLNGDNWESTAIFWPIFLQFITCALIFGFGGPYKRPVWTNLPLALSWGVLFILASYLVLSESNSFTRVFHMASEQFNYAGVAEDIPQSVWAEYQTLWRQANPGRVPCFPDPENAEPCNPGLDITRRIIFFVIILSGLVLATGWQALVVDNYGKRLKAYFPVKDRVLLTL